MESIVLKTRTAALSGAAIIALTAGLAQAATVVTIEAPGVTTPDSVIAGGTTVTTETFDGFAAGSFVTATGSAIGTYSGGRIDPANNFGGAGNTGQYLFSFTGGSSVTLTTPATYFGLWWSAGSPDNAVTLSAAGSDLFTFDTQDVLTFLATQTNGVDYFGNPVNGANSGQPYVFINFFSDTVFDTVTLTGNNFESDNHSVAAEYVDITGTPIAPVPLPATLPLLGGVIAGAYALRSRRRAKA